MARQGPGKRGFVRNGHGTLDTTPIMQAAIGIQPSQCHDISGHTMTWPCKDSIGREEEVPITADCEIPWYANPSPSIRLLILTLFSQAHN